MNVVLHRFNNIIKRELEMLNFEEKLNVFKPVVIGNAALNNAIGSKNIYKWEIIILDTHNQKKSLSYIGNDITARLSSTIETFLKDLSEKMNNIYKNEMEIMNRFFAMNNVTMLGYDLEIEIQDEPQKESISMSRDYFRYVKNHIEHNIYSKFIFNNVEYDTSIISILILLDFTINDYLTKRVRYLVENDDMYGEDIIIPYYGDGLKYATLPFLIYTLHDYVVKTQDEIAEEDFKLIIKRLNNPIGLNSNSIGTLAPIFNNNYIQSAYYLDS